MLYGTAVDVTPYRKAVTQVGMAWGLPIPDTQRWLDLIRQEEIADDIYSMWLHTDQIAAHAKAGQFVSVYCNDGSRLLPRPISICEIDRKDGAIRLVYRVAGKGTAEFSPFIYPLFYSSYTI